VIIIIFCIDDVVFDTHNATAKHQLSG